MNVVMTAPRLAAEAVALLEAAGARIHYMDPFPSRGESPPWRATSARSPSCRGRAR